MADALGELGLDTGQFNASADAAIDKITQLGKEALLVTGNLAAMAVVVGGTLAVGIYNSRKRVEELEEALRDIEKTDPFSDKLTSVGNLENKIKSLRAEIKKMDDEGVGSRIFRFIGSAHLLGGKGFDDSEAKVAATRAKAAQDIEDTIKRIGSKEGENLQILELRLKGEKEQAELLKSDLEYNTKIAKATEAGLPGLAATLDKERLISAELIKQEALKKSHDSQQASISAQAEEAARQAIAEIENQQHIKDLAGKAEDKKYEQEEKRMRQEEKEDQEALYELAQKQTEQARRRMEYIQELARANKEIAFNEEVRADIGDIKQSGDYGGARTTATRADFAARKKQAIEDHNDDALRQIERQEKQALRDDLAAQHDTTNAQRRSQRREEHHRDVSAEKQASKDEELIKRGERGADSRDIREAQARKAERDKIDRNVDNAKKDANNSKTWSESDAKNLQACAEALKPKD